MSVKKKLLWFSTLISHLQAFLHMYYGLFGIFLVKLVSHPVHFNTIILFQCLCSGGHISWVQLSYGCRQLSSFIFQLPYMYHVWVRILIILIAFLVRILYYNTIVLFQCLCSSRHISWCRLSCGCRRFSSSNLPTVLHVLRFGRNVPRLPCRSSCLIFHGWSTLSMSWP